MAIPETKNPFPSARRAQGSTFFFTTYSPAPEAGAGPAYASLVFKDLAAFRTPTIDDDPGTGPIRAKDPVFNIKTVFTIFTASIILSASEEGAACHAVLGLFRHHSIAMRTGRSR